MSMIQRNTTSLREGVNVWSREKRLRPNSESIMMLKDHTMKSTLMDLRLMRGLGQQRSSTAISRMVRRPAASCPRDSRITAPSLLLRLQPLPWHLTIIGTWTLYSTMLYYTLTQCLAGDWGRRFRKPSHLSYHEPPLGTERQRHMCSLLLVAKPLWHWG